MAVTFGEKVLLIQRIFFSLLSLLRSTLGYTLMILVSLLTGAIAGEHFKQSRNLITSLVKRKYLSREGNCGRQ